MFKNSPVSVCVWGGGGYEQSSEWEVKNSPVSGGWGGV